ncbi:MAG: PTS sugar transporter subunit IIA [Treponemataceae bacterium]|nr:PTS sugar transporter subunit IIA [Treponemataceae bacterium]
MDSEINLLELIQRGGVLNDVQGKTAEEIYKNVCEDIALPFYVDRNVLYTELCEREKMISTAIGNGISLPHPRHPIMKKEFDQQITVCFLHEPVDFKALDHKPVKVLFVILTNDQQAHLKILSQLAFVFQNEKMKSLLKGNPDYRTLQDTLKEIL